MKNELNQIRESEPLKESEEEFVRDVTQVMPMAKSEVRRRLKELMKEREASLIEKVDQQMLKFLAKYSADRPASIAEMRACWEEIIKRLSEE